MLSKCGVIGKFVVNYAHFTCVLDQAQIGAFPPFSVSKKLKKARLIRADNRSVCDLNFFEYRSFMNPFTRRVCLFRGENLGPSYASIHSSAYNFHTVLPPHRKVGAGATERDCFPCAQTRRRVALPLSCLSCVLWAAGAVRCSCSLNYSGHPFVSACDKKMGWFAIRVPVAPSVSHALAPRVAVSPHQGKEEQVRHRVLIFVFFSFNEKSEPTSTRSVYIGRLSKNKNAKKKACICVPSARWQRSFTGTVSTWRKLWYPRRKRESLLFVVISPRNAVANKELTGGNKETHASGEEAEACSRRHQATRMQSANDAIHESFHRDTKARSHDLVLPHDMVPTR